MEVFKIILIVIECLASVALIVAILFQSGKESGLGSLSGNSDSYLNKSKAGDLDKILSSATKWIALLWAGLALGLCLF